MISIVDYNLGNVASIRNALDYLGEDSEIISDTNKIKGAEKLILCGVGSFDKAIENLSTLDLLEALNYAVIDRSTPILGICLGMQIMGNSSEEGIRPGFGWIEANCKKISFENDPTLKVPNNGWRNINPRNDSSLFRDAVIAPRYYFNHSFHMVCQDDNDIAAKFEYGTEIVCSIERDNIFGVQFHPEKSHSFGMAVLLNFANL
mgnify:CR=1 FL=1|tara:strand:- start:299 stop:910 length:612 start_codon:yes stop_codon:yes gene_type:complete